MTETRGIVRTAAIWFPAAPELDPVLRALESVTPQVETTRPDLLLFKASGPARYLGGEDALVEKVQAALGELGIDNARVGIADGPFAAEFAAHRRAVVAPGSSAEFLAPLPLATLDRVELTGLLLRLGIHTLGAFAQLPATDVHFRFGPDGALAHLLANGLDDRLLAPLPPPPDFEVISQLDPPVERVDAAAFVAKSMADELHDRLTHAGFTCAQVVIEARTEHGEELIRSWRHDGALSASDIADRVRWQLDGWLSGSSVEAKPTAGISVLLIRPDQLQRGADNQSALWGRSGVADARMARLLARIQGILGPDAVLTAVLGGGRDPVTRVSWVSWGEPREPRLSDAATWPGRLPNPSPATVFFDPLPVWVCDALGQPVAVNRRLALSGAPASITLERERVAVAGWAGPWPADERWWDTSAHRRRARMQLLSPDGRAWLVALESGTWWAEGTYD